MRVFHLSHHQGCIADFAEVGRHLGLEVESATFDDGYNIGPERADRAWRRWKDRLNGADVVLVSDTAPLARIVLEHLDSFAGQLVVWVCNRFDYTDQQTNDCDFPDPPFYDLFRHARSEERVEIVSFTAFESVYAREHGVDLGPEVIRPLGLRAPQPVESPVPASVRRDVSVLVPAYHNDLLFDLAERCEGFGVAGYCGRYAGAGDAATFKAVVHVPYAWSTFALFEHMQNGMPVFVPSVEFLRRLATAPGFFWADPREDYLELAEWFAPGRDFLVRYDSWEDLGRRLLTTDLDAVRAETRAAARQHAETTLSAWKRLFSRLGSRTSPRPGAPRIVASPDANAPTPAAAAPARPEDARKAAGDPATQAVVERLLPYREHLDAHTAAASSVGIWEGDAASRFDSLVFAFAHFAGAGARTVVELGTIRSFVHGGLEGCNSDEPSWWQPARPETWDWGAGCFSLLAAICLGPLRPHIHTVDSSSAHIKRCQLVTADYAALFSYHVSDSVEYIRSLAPGSVDLLYLDTGDMWPLEPAASHQLEEARAICETGVMSPHGIILIDDVRNATPARHGDDSAFAKAKYALPYLLGKGYEIVFDGYQVALASR